MLTFSFSSLVSLTLAGLSTEPRPLVPRALSGSIVEAGRVLAGLVEVAGVAELALPVTEGTLEGTEGADVIVESPLRLIALGGAIVPSIEGRAR